MIVRKRILIFEKSTKVNIKVINEEDWQRKQVESLKDNGETAKKKKERGGEERGETINNSFS